ncbi:TIR domain-containing protein [Wohlfahrtiimonas chitiniclastica]|uniref:TIR domain-containing protein n=1 Tax=Wohlfahrtiimonas chitiniclastica TaxID=400946 RepID=A0AB35BYZ9_9GAMM|nr:TIR domain-containing protein [Wohlfahrtiimonas chitiniclastica]MBS7825178.1 TIR domain-containing protein [Wohlfahrtiimonas chitiniclastica]MBS7840790.1 TIR domain-containing protein [Wohlfahrtiimonas chitiniclastica]
MSVVKHRVFISYHHDNDQYYKDYLSKFGEANDIFIDMSVDTGDIDENLDDQTIRRKIRDEYIKDASVLILLVGTETKNRKHIDWEIYTSMYDGAINKKLGILVVQLPSISPQYYRAPHGNGEKEKLYPKTSSWIHISSRAEYERRYPYLPARIIDNLIAKGVKISITRWADITNNDHTLNKDNLSKLIDWAFQDKSDCEYDLSRSMRRNNA